MRYENYLSALMSCQVYRSDFEKELSKQINIFIKTPMRLMKLRDAKGISIVKIIDEVNNKFNQYGVDFNKCLPVTFIYGEPYDIPMERNSFIGILKLRLPGVYDTYIKHTKLKLKR